MSYTKEELDGAISSPQANGKIFDERSEAKVIYFNHHGKEDKSLGEKTASAKSVQVDRVRTYFVKRKNSGELFEPKLHSLVAKAKYMTSNSFSFVRMSENGFNAYLRFLQTGHKSLIYSAEKEVLNG